MKYLKVFTDFANTMELLGDAERGRLFTAMLKYAESGTEPELKGNERFLWMAAKADIDRQRENYDKRCETNKQIATNRYQSAPESTNRNESYQDKDKDKEKTKKNNNTPPTPLPGAWDGVSSELHDALIAFEEMRKKLRRPLTERAKQLALSNLRKLSMDEQTQIAIVNQSVLHGWQSFYALKDEEKKEAAPPPMYKKLTLRR